MKKEEILDDPNLQNENKLFFNFQIIEFSLIALFCSFIILRSIFSFSGILNVIMILYLLVIVFPVVRIYLEYKNQLITGFGIVLKAYLLINASVIFTGVLFKIMHWEYASEMLIVSLTSMTFPFIIYALALQKVSIPIKLIMAFNALFMGVLAIGMLFRIESWAYGSELTLIGFTLTLLSLFAFGLILRMKPNQKESYHAINYLARSILFLAFGLSYLF